MKTFLKALIWISLIIVAAILLLFISSKSAGFYTIMDMIDSIIAESKNELTPTSSSMVAAFFRVF
mgnify:CR=1 FL=1